MTPEDYMRLAFNLLALLALILALYGCANGGMSGTKVSVRGPSAAQAFTPLPASDASYYTLPHGVLLVFVSQRAMEGMFPDAAVACARMNAQLRGYFDATHRGGAPILVAVTCPDPRAVTPDVVEAMVRNLGLLDRGAAVPFATLVTTPGDQWDVNGILCHELGHLGDYVNPGHPCQLLHDLWPAYAAADPGEKVRNPWAVLKMHWPQWNTHAGYSEWDYRKGPPHPAKAGGADGLAVDVRGIGLTDGD